MTSILYDRRIRYLWAPLCQRGAGDGPFEPEQGLEESSGIFHLSRRLFPKAHKRVYGAYYLQHPISLCLLQDPYVSSSISSVPIYLGVPAGREFIVEPDHRVRLHIYAAAGHRTVYHRTGKMLSASGRTRNVYLPFLIVITLSWSIPDIDGSLIRA